MSRDVDMCKRRLVEDSVARLEKRFKGKICDQRVRLCLEDLYFDVYA